MCDAQPSSTCVQNIRGFLGIRISAYTRLAYNAYCFSPLTQTLLKLVSFKEEVNEEEEQFRKKKIKLYSDLSFYTIYG